MGKTNIMGQAQATATQDAARLAVPAIHGAVVAGRGRISRKGDGSIWHYPEFYPGNGWVFSNNDE